MAGPGASFIMASIISWIFPQGSKHVMQVFLVNEPIPVLVDHAESLLELLNLGLVKHGVNTLEVALGVLWWSWSLLFARHGGS